MIGTRAAVKAPPDGYTLLMITTGLSLSANPGYDVAKDFAPIGTIASIPIVVMANASVPVKSLSDVIALAKKEPGKVTIGSPPPPTLNYFGAEQFKAMTGIDVSIVTYKGTGPLTNDLVGGHVMLAFNTLPPAIGNIQAGKLNAIAVCAPERLAAIPDVPTAAEAGLPGLDVVLYYGLAAPAGTPRPIIERLNKELRAIVTSDEFKKRIITDGGGPAPSTPEEHAANIVREEGKWSAMIKKLGLKVGVGSGVREPNGTFWDCLGRANRASRENSLHQRDDRMAKNRGIITTTQDAISDVARTGVEGARSIAGSAVGTAAGAANSAAQGRDRRGAHRRPGRPAAGRPGQEGARR